MKQVATDKGIVMTQGSGSSGALGNGDCNDSPEVSLCHMEGNTHTHTHTHTQTYTYTHIYA